MKGEKMEEKKYSLDMHLITKAGRISRIILGIICLVIDAWFVISIAGTRASTGSAWIAVVFLFLFSLWMIGSGLGYTDRFIIIGEDMVKLRKRSFLPPVTLAASELNYVEFKPLQINFGIGEKTLTLRLGAYFPGHSEGIMEAVVVFCRKNGIEIRGLGSDNTEK